VSPVVAAVLAASAVLAAGAAVVATPAVVDAGRVRRRLAASPGGALGGARSSGVLARVGASRHVAAVVRLARPRRRSRADRTLPVLLEDVARELRAGASLTAAVSRAASAVDPALDPTAADLAGALRHGAPLAVALDEWARADAAPARALAATALTLAAETGGTTALVVDGVADTLRDRVALEREVAALSSQARASAALLVVAPVVVAALAASADPRIAAFLLGSPAGWGCITGGLVLDGLGALWMRAVVARAV